MKTYAPKYYNNFVCIADKCNHSCCIGWEIDIDPKTAEKYSTFDKGYGAIVKESVDFKDVPHFRLAENDRCPHLNENGLCRIILELGEEHLCDICREHPRFYNYTGRGIEVGLGLACQEAGRLILSSDLYGEFDELTYTDSIDCNYTEDHGFDPLILRDDIFKTLSDSTLSYGEKLNNISEKYKVSVGLLSDSEAKTLLKNLEYLDPSHKIMFSCYSSKTEVPYTLEKICCRVLAYFIYRHCSQAEDYDYFRAVLGFCLFCEKLFVSVIKTRKANTLEACAEIARIISEELEYSEDNTQTITDEFLFALHSEND